MPTVGTVVREHAWVPLPITAGAAILRGQFVSVTSGLAVRAVDATAIGVATSDSDDDKLQVDVAWISSGATVSILTTPALAVAAGDHLGVSAGGLATPAATGNSVALAVAPALNGQVEAILL